MGLADADSQFAETGANVIVNTLRRHLALYGTANNISAQSQLNLQRCCTPTTLGKTGIAADSQGVKLPSIWDVRRKLEGRLAPCGKPRLLPKEVTTCTIMFVENAMSDTNRHLAECAYAP